MHDNTERAAASVCCPASFAPGCPLGADSTTLPTPSPSRSGAPGEPTAVMEVDSPAARFCRMTAIACKGPTALRATDWRSQRAAAMRAVVRVLALRPSLLASLLHQFAFRKVLGAEARLIAFRALGADIGEEVFIGARVKVRSPENLIVGDGSELHGSIVIDSWEIVRFGRGVVVSDGCVFLTSDHDVNSPSFAGYRRGGEWEARAEPLTIGDFAWLPRAATVLRGAHIGEGAVVGVGSIVTRPVEPWTVVAGNPARKIKDREAHIPTVAH